MREHKFSPNIIFKTFLGYAAEPDLLDSDIDDDLHQGDGDTIDIGNATNLGPPIKIKFIIFLGRREDDINTEENNFITESSSEVTVNRIISADRPQTPEFCLTGTQITQETGESLDPFFTPFALF